MHAEKTSQSIAWTPKSKMWSRGIDPETPKKNMYYQAVYRRGLQERKVVMGGKRVNGLGEG
jgi:hypothetical protein